MLQPAGTLYFKEIIRIKYEGKTTNPCISVKKLICNTKGAAICLPFLLGGHYDFIDPCGYHLQVNDPERIPGTSNTYYAPFHDWLEASK